jgi:hypothetical protein
MIAYCQSRGLPIKATQDKPYSTDANLLGLTHEAGELESLATPAHRVEPGMGVFPEQAPDQPEQVQVRFEQGELVALNGRSVDLLTAFQQANRIAGRHGVGIGLHTVENRFVGIKSRGVYEAPAMELLGRCYEFLLQLVLDRRTRRIYDQVSAHIAEQIYQGYWFDTATQACRLGRAALALQPRRGLDGGHRRLRPPGFGGIPEGSGGGRPRPQPGRTDLPVGADRSSTAPSARSRRGREAQARVPSACRSRRGTLGWMRETIS